MGQRQTNAFAVPDAKRLNDCFNELSEAIAARPQMDGDRDLWALDYATLPGGPDGMEREGWSHRCGSKDVAMAALRGAVSNGILQLWVHGAQGESKVDRYALKELTIHTFASGTYQPANREPESEGLADRALWIKERDWQQYMADLWAMRYGIDLANPAPPATKQLLPPDGQFVTLSHALTWIAFGISMDCNQLHEVLTLDRYGEGDPQEAIKAALAELVEFGRAARISMQGKFRGSHREEVRALLTAPIEPIKFEDYRQFNYLHDELRHGEGLTWWRTLHGVAERLAGGGRADSYVQIGVNRADLLRQYRPDGPIEVKPDAILWSDLGPAELERAKELVREAEGDEWWNWPQAVAWAGCRNLEHIATMRLCAEPWTRDRNDHSIALGAEHFLGTAYCSDPEWAERELQRAIERGEVRTQGRSSRAGISESLKPTVWRGGKVVFNRTATLVSAIDTLSEWASDVAVNRADLMTVFPTNDMQHSVEPHRPEMATITDLPLWLNPYQLAAWVQYRAPDIVAKASHWNGLAAQRMYGGEPQIGQIADAIEALQGDRIPAFGQKDGGTFEPIAGVEWTRIALAPLELHRQHPFVRIQFKREDVLAVFPAIDSAPDGGNAAAAGAQVSVDCAQPKAKGRTRGTGFQRADAPILERMAEAIASNPALNATSAARLFAGEAVGASFEARVDRLARAYRAGRNRG